MQDNLFVKNEGQCNTVILAHEISHNITEILTRKIKEELEGICVNDGYIKKDSIQIVSKSMGKSLVSFFNGSISYTIKYTSDVCNPLQNAIIKATVSTITKMGILAYGGEVMENSPLNILLAVQHHQDNENFSKLQEKDVIYVKVLGKRFEYGDTQISIIGLLDEKPDTVNNTNNDNDNDNKKKTETKNTITYFNQSKNYKWLTNFNVANPFEYKGRTYATMEHAYQAQQVDYDDFKDLFTQGSDTYIGDVPNAAKKAGNKTNIKKMKKTIVADWNESKVNILESIMEAYFDANPELKTKLIQTGDNELVFKGLSVDAFWGLDKTGEGENNHGILLMKLRDEFK